MLIKRTTFWALKLLNLDLSATSTTHKLQMLELEEWRHYAYENTQIYKERTKHLHVACLKGTKEFQVGDCILLFNARVKLFSGKLRLLWSGPFMVIQVFPYGTMKIRNAQTEPFKVNDNLLKPYLGDDVECEELLIKLEEPLVHLYASI
ncbi:unnamed protein product [Linum trigynum]|uniref:Reverse transcriptase domain-containing protein n=1 Tax=Linum trigynum TaxID=586398 RepID=A0AAV2F992_9ROSI